MMRKWKHDNEIMNKKKVERKRESCREPDSLFVTKEGLILMGLIIIILILETDLF